MKKIDKNDVEDILSLTPTQEGILFHYLKEPDDDIYFEQLCLCVEGSIDLKRFKKSWQHVIKSNQMLRTIYQWENIKKPVQIILKKNTANRIPISFRNISEDEELKDQNKERIIDIIMSRERAKKFDIREETFRVGLYQLTEEKFYILINQHHIIYDGWSTSIILKEFFNAYHCLDSGKSLVTQKKNEFKEYIKWIGNADKDKQKDYWKQYLTGVDTKTSLPVKVKSTKRSKAVSRHSLTLSKKTTKSIGTLSKERGITTAAFFYAAWGILLQKYNDSNDVIFGITISGRNAMINGIENIVGLFINTLPLRVTRHESESVFETLKNINSAISSREEYEGSSLADIERFSEFVTDGELFDSIVVIENYPVEDAFGKASSSIGIKGLNVFYKTNFDLTIAISISNEIEIVFTYNESIIDHGIFNTMSHHLENIITEIINNTDKPVSQIEMLTSDEKNQLLYDFNDSSKEVSFTEPIYKTFEEQTQLTPYSTAIIYKDKHFSYKQINEKANQLARVIRNYGVDEESVVGVMMDYSPDLIICLFAILKAGGAYLPIELDLPSERVQYMLKDSGAKLLITKLNQMDDFSFTTLQSINSTSDLKIIKTELRDHISDFNSIPIPDRSHIRFNNYKDKIGMASVSNSISIQTTRGCPYKCLFCHKIWSKHHVHRSAESIYNEIEYYNRYGVQNFAFIDDCFNLDKRNSRSLFRSILDNNLKVQLFFPNGLRGDIMTPDYIDLMVEAGTRGINLSLETASPRLQKLIKKNLNLERFRNVVDYIATQHPNIILELATLHGLPTETEEEAFMTLNFIKETKWLHFPYIHILKIFPNTEMEAFALASGVSKEDIMVSKDRAFHELPETLPFPKSFTRQYQADFLNNYFLSKERLLKVLPVEMGILEEKALVQKYNAYLPVAIKTLEDLLQFTGLDQFSIETNQIYTSSRPSIFDEKFSPAVAGPNAKKILFLDLSQHFSSQSMLYSVSEQPLGAVCLLTYLKKQFNEKIDGRIYKSGIDFDSFEELNKIIENYKPDLISIRTLTFFKEFFHQTVSLIRQWGVKVPIIAGGPYASSDYDTILKDRNVNLVAIGEGEYTIEEIISQMFKNGFKLPNSERLKEIKSVAFVDEPDVQESSMNVLLYDQISRHLSRQDKSDLEVSVAKESLAYVMYTSGSTGNPKGVMVEHRQINNCISWMQDKFGLTQGDIVAQRTNLSFDPSVWEIFWPLFVGAKVKILDKIQRKDAEYLVDLMEKSDEITVLYGAATLIQAFNNVLKSRSPKPVLKMPWLVIGAEPVTPEAIEEFYDYYEGRIVNTYGPTECTINNTFFDIEKGKNYSAIPIGKPVTNNHIYIVSQDSQLMPVNVPGRICIGGDSVARGYIRSNETVKKAFVSNIFGSGRLHQTGDLGRWTPEGNIEILGRDDEQAKIRGYRIEPAEIENVLVKHPGIEKCVVVSGKTLRRQKTVKTCKRCGITSQYQDVKINSDSLCEICDNYTPYDKAISAYFKTLDVLDELIKSESSGSEGGYDCALLYSGGRGAAYALYHLVERGHKILAITYDNDFFSKKAIQNIKQTTTKLNVDHIVISHPNSKEILLESLSSASTVCKGCFHTSSTLAVDYAFNNKIKLVIGATLSRGQIIENKLMPFFKQKIFEVQTIEEQIPNLLRTGRNKDTAIFDLIGSDILINENKTSQVKVVDFYRYCQPTNEEIISYLDQKDAYWKTRKNYAVYSTNCPIKQHGDFAHLNQKKFHFYGHATSWEKRLKNISLENVKEDLHCRITNSSFKNFANKLGFKGSINVNKDDNLFVYYTSKEELTVPDLKQFLLKSLPSYMVPLHYIPIDTIPLTTNGKINKKMLPDPDKNGMVSKSTYVKPDSDIEVAVADIWKELLEINKVGTEDNFFDLGGNSLNIMQVSTQLKKQLNKDVSISQLFTYPTVRSLADYLEGDSEDNSHSSLGLKSQENLWDHIESSEENKPTPSLSESESSALNSDIAIIGMNGRFPGASNVAEFWENIKNGVESISYFSDEELLNEGIDENLVKNKKYL